jgi:NhaA family Na+:H+ antiporter
MDKTENANHEENSAFPKEPIDKITNPLKKFLHIESASGIVLIVATIIALILANSNFAEGFHHFWEQNVGFHIGSFSMDLSLHHWINDFLMAVFFFVVGLEVKRELIIGELSDMKKAALPIMGAIGGMLIPAALYLLMQYGEPGQHGWGIPMATDIAFVVGCLAVLGKRIPSGLRVFLLSLAIADDIGAILVIAIGYTEDLNVVALVYAAIGVFTFVTFLKVGIRNVAVLLIVGLFVWYQIFESGIHATIAGVIIGLLTPINPWVSKSRLKTAINNSFSFVGGDGWSPAHDEYQSLRDMEVASRKAISPVVRLENMLHPWVGFVIMPLFALSNAGVTIEIADLTNPVANAVVLGLFVGKPVGITLFSWMSVKIGFAKLPSHVNWGAMVGAGFLGGIGFTMALFIAGLALSGDLLDSSKIGILTGSLASAIVGVIILIKTLPVKEK